MALQSFNDDVREWGDDFNIDSLTLEDSRYATLFGLYRAAMMSRRDPARVIKPIINTMKLEGMLIMHPVYRSRIARMVIRDELGMRTERRRRER